MNKASRIFACAVLAALWQPVGGGARGGEPTMGAGVADVVAKVRAGVVKISVARAPDGKGKADSAADLKRTVGSGFVIDDTGLIATNRHVVEGALSVFVATDDGGRFRAQVVGIAAKADIALLRVAPEAHLPPVAWGDSDRLRPGDAVVAIGSPFGFDNTVTAGVVSSVNRDIMESPFDDYIQTDAAINHGNSGGPLFNMAGEVVGMNSVLFGPTSGSSGLGFSIPSNQLRFMLSRLADPSLPPSGMLPIETQQVTGLMAAAIGAPHAGGALITRLGAGADLMNGKIDAGDVIIKFNGQAVTDPRDLARKAAQASAGSEATLELYRAGQWMEAKVPLLPLGGMMPPTAQANMRPKALGLRFAQAQKASGATVADVDPMGSAADSGLQKGDVILRVQGQAVDTAEKAGKALAALAASKKGYAAVLVRRDKQTWWVPVSLPN